MAEVIEESDAATCWPNRSNLGYQGMAGRPAASTAPTGRCESKRERERARKREEERKGILSRDAHIREVMESIGTSTRRRIWAVQESFARVMSSVPSWLCCVCPWSCVSKQQQQMAPSESTSQARQGRGRSSRRSHWYGPQDLKRRR
jgi:hypothetical protein